MRSFALIPAAGQSRRMATSKLLLELRGRPLIDRTLRAWVDSNVDHVVVIVRENDAPLIDRCRRFDVRLVLAQDDPPEMRDSLQIGLSVIADCLSPLPSDCWLVAPADIPDLKPASINCLLANYDPRRPRILVPQVDGRNGHPVLLPWSAVTAFRELPQDAGLNMLLRGSAVDPVCLQDRGVLHDVDTPADFQQLMSEERK